MCIKALANICSHSWKYAIAVNFRKQLSYTPYLVPNVVCLRPELLNLIWTLTAKVPFLKELQ